MKKYMKIVYLGFFVLVLCVSNTWAKVKVLNCSKTYDNGERQVTEYFSVTDDPDLRLPKEQVQITGRYWTTLKIEKVERDGNGRIFALSGGDSRSYNNDWELREVSHTATTAEWKNVKNFSNNVSLYPCSYN